MRNIPLHLTVADLIIRLTKLGSEREATMENFEGDKLVKNKSQIKGFQLQGDFFICSSDLYEGLTPTAIRLVYKIQQELMMNNPLWQCADKKSAHTRATLALLKKKEIIYPIPGTDMFIVNPAKIRKGRPLSSLAALYKRAVKAYEKDRNWKPSEKDIVRMTAPDEVSVSLTTARMNTAG